MEALIAIIIGALTMGGVFLMLQRRTFPVILGLSLLSYAVNIFIFISGRVALNAPPIIGMGPAPIDPLPQALVLRRSDPPHHRCFFATLTLVHCVRAAFAPSSSSAADAPQLQATGAEHCLRDSRTFQSGLHRHGGQVRVQRPKIGVR